MTDIESSLISHTDKAGFASSLLSDTTVPAIRIMLADAPSAFRDGLRALLTAQTDLTVVGETSNVDGILALAADCKPDMPRNIVPTDKPVALSRRERKVVCLVAQGFRNREIADKLFISEQTVKNHMHNIFEKIGVQDRLELALYAIYHRLHETHG